LKEKGNIMAIPNSKSTFKEYCLRALGKGVIDINVSDDQADDRIDEALQYYLNYHSDGVERVYLKHQLTEAEITRMKSNETAVTATDLVDSSITADWLQQENYIPVPDTVLSVNKVFPITDQLTTNMFDVRYQLRLNDLYDFSSTSIINYEMTMRHLDYLDHILTGEMPIQFKEHQNRLYIYTDVDTNFNDTEFLLIECYRKLDPDTYTSVYDDMYLKRYATELLKKQWGANLSKFNGVAMLGGVTMNGEQIYSQAIEEIQRLEEQIQLHHELPINYMIG
tara:strand:+ start:803 stop:1642 length:840 start_codon:yes stop_codon:yes gene_type:complete